jgi:hypothetical protein
MKHIRERLKQKSADRLPDTFVWMDGHKAVIIVLLYLPSFHARCFLTMLRSWDDVPIPVEDLGNKVASLGCLVSEIARELP